MTTKIEWTWVPDGKGGRKKGETVNHQVGCSEVSPACRHCYAARIAARGMTDHHRGLTVHRANGVHWNGRINRAPEQLAKPLRWRAPRGIFWGSMTDLFHESVIGTEDGCRYMAASMGVMAATPQHTHLLLTKRTDWMRRWFDWLYQQAEAVTPRTRDVTDDLDDAPDGSVVGGYERIGDQWVRVGHPSAIALSAIVDDMASDGDAPSALRGSEPADSWPLPNVWLGATAEDQTWLDRRVGDLLACPAAVHYLSVEPMVGGRVTLPQAFLDRGKRAWIIAGGESGPGARPSHPDWFRHLRDQCVEAGVPFFYKQAGAWTADESIHGTMHLGGPLRKMFTGPDHLLETTTVASTEWKNIGRVNYHVWDDALGRSTQLHRVGKKAAGRLLDGRTWDEFPEVESC